MISNQRGGIVSFGIVAVVLVGLLAGGLFLSKNQARVARDTDTTTPQVATPKTSDKSTKDATKSDNESPASTAEPKPATPAAEPAPTVAPAAQPVLTPTPATPAATTQVASTGPSAELPATGPADAAIVTLALSALAFTGYRLRESRRGVQRAALRR